MNRLMLQDVELFNQAQQLVLQETELEMLPIQVVLIDKEKKKKTDFLEKLKLQEAFLVVDNG